MTFRFDPGAITRNWPLKLFSLAFAIALWAFVNLGERDSEKVLSVPLELVNVPTNLIVTSPVVDAVDVRVRGPRTLLGTLDDRRQAIRLDLASIRAGRTTFELGPEVLSLPRAVRVVRLSPTLISLDLERLVEKRVPVTVALAGPVPFGYRLEEQEVQPSMVQVHGPQAILADIDAVETDPVRVTPVSGILKRAVGLRSPDGLVEVEPGTVHVRLRLQEVLETEGFSNVEIEIRHSGDGARVTPKWGSVEVRGPARLVREMRLNGPVLYVDAGDLAPGTHSAPLAVEIPERLEVLKLAPETVRVTVPKVTPEG